MILVFPAAFCFLKGKKQLLPPHFAFDNFGDVGTPFSFADELIDVG